MNLRWIERDGRDVLQLGKYEDYGRGPGIIWEDVPVMELKPLKSGREQVVEELAKELICSRGPSVTKEEAGTLAKAALEFFENRMIAPYFEDPVRTDFQIAAGYNRALSDVRKALFGFE